MSIDAESPTHSSSSDDFCAIIDDLLDTASERSDDEEITNDTVGDYGTDTERTQNVEEIEEDEDDDIDTERIKRQKMAVSESTGDIDSSTFNSDAERNLLNVSTHEVECAHSTVIGNLCVLCGQEVSMMNGSAVPLRYIHKSMWLGKDEMARLKEKDAKDLLQRRKLVLVLDLDHTLLNSTRLQDLKTDEEYLFHEIESELDVSKRHLFKLDHMRMMTKLRPFVRKFLEEASEKFEMYIYTMGERAYANEMAKLLDPREVYFNSRVIAKDDCTQIHQKGLDVVLGGENAILILDDTEFVWRNHKENLILMERYHYFASSCQQFGYNCKSLSQSKSDENEANGTLSIILEVLKKIHERFFDLEHGALLDRDVKRELKAVRKGVLDGCKIVFSRIFPNQSASENKKTAQDVAENHPLWKMAEELGAICAIDTDSSVTHVIARDKSTVKARWATENKKFLVNPRWLEASNFFWNKKPEDEYPVE